MLPRKPRKTPEQLSIYAANMAELYESLEGEIIRIIINRLNRGHDDILQWQAERLSELGFFNNDVTKLLAEVTHVAEPEIKRMFEETGVGIVQDIDKVMPYDPKPVPSNLDTVMKGYADQTWLEIDNYVNQTLVTTHYGIGTAQKAYTDVLNRTQAMFNTGLYTFEQSLERAINELVQKGIESTMIDKGGHTWSLEGYVRTVLKSTLNNTYEKVKKDRMAEYGIHTVVVTSHAGSREACSIIQGEVVDLRPMEEIPADSRYMSIYDPYWRANYGEPGGHRGVNCRHQHIPFIPGVSTNNQPYFDAETNERVAENRATQRRIEREIVKYKKNLMVAEHMGSETADYWKQMISRRQRAMREHLKENGEYLTRQYKREKVYTPLDVLLKDFSYRD